MSRGLGAMQQGILETLSVAKNNMVYYRGSGRVVWGSAPVPPTWKYDKPGWVMVWNKRILLADDIFDLRASLAYMAGVAGEKYARQYVNGDYQASFSRAAKQLVKRGELIRMDMIPIVDWDGDVGNTVIRCSDGDYVFAGRQLRFVRLP